MFLSSEEPQSARSPKSTLTFLRTPGPGPDRNLADFDPVVGLSSVDLFDLCRSCLVFDFRSLDLKIMYLVAVCERRRGDHVPPPAWLSPEVWIVKDESDDQDVHWRDRVKKTWRKRPQWFSSELLESERQQPVSADAVAVEFIRDGRREFVIREKDGGNEAKTMVVTEVNTKKRAWIGRMGDRFWRYFLPAGFPSSVGPDYLEYTRWRWSAFFWGGAVGVFATQGLLMAVGVGRQTAAPMAAALQWVVRDGMGRVGRIFFSQVGTGFDAETKQFRLAAAVVLNVACALESATRAIPQLFLPVACLANMVKGASTVAAASTRGAIYRSFMRRENLGDITAKQETVGVAGDLLGTALGILISRRVQHDRAMTLGAFAFVSHRKLLRGSHMTNGATRSFPSCTCIRLIGKSKVFN